VRVLLEFGRAVQPQVHATGSERRCRALAVKDSPGPVVVERGRRDDTILL
jgi:hypothetical protein